MRKLVALLLVLGVAASFGATEILAQEGSATGFQVLKEKFIQGDWRWMAPILVCMILGLAFCIERVITLNLATANTDKLLTKSTTVWLKVIWQELWKFVSPQVVRLQAYCMKDCEMWTRDRKEWKELFLHTDRFRWDYWKKD